MANDLPRRMTFAAIAVQAAKMTPFAHLDPQSRKGLMRRGAAMGLAPKDARLQIEAAFRRGVKKETRNG